MIPTSRITGMLSAGVFRPTWILGCLLALSELIYVELVRFEAVSSTRSVVTFIALIAALFVLYGAAYFVVRNQHTSYAKAVTLVMVGAVLFRVTLLFAGIPPGITPNEATSRLRADIRGEAVTYDSYLIFDNDIWRYLWDGHVGANGVNPYRFEPRNRGLDYLEASPGGNTQWSDIRANVNHSDIPTIYPPFAQLVFRVAHAIAPGSVFIMKSLFVAFDLLTILIIALTLRLVHRPVIGVVLYAWNPLVIKAIAGSGHVDAVLAMLLMTTVYFALRGSRSCSAVAWGLSILVKISPVILLPFLIRRLGWSRSAIGVAVAVIGYFPFFDTKVNPFAGLLTFASEWQFNSGFFTLVEWLAGPFVSNPVPVAKIAASLIFLAVMIWLIGLDNGDDETLTYCCTSALGGMLILSPTVMPWYLVWIIPLAIVARISIWIQFSVPICLSFFVMVDGTDRTWVLFVEYGILALLLGQEYMNIRRTKSTHASGDNCDSAVFTPSSVRLPRRGTE